ncbi:flagellar protein FlaG [Thermodesulforhabdus norvegica]|uniref:Flagellar protein FlaG n=1 Tax=Thermodesulforhabdus norvegica TaxID=39841 RepID=A0A1I4QS45_9BACT|nr:flagellar protein FlaG [Thermodesulforhabdus norvegica]SFM42892.1 flagellar protein FlaG [Thermodesulforhabdus norvegica]
MEPKVPEVQPVSIEQWAHVKPEVERRKQEIIKPVEESSGSKSKKVGEGKEQVQTKLLDMSLEDVKELAEQIENYLKEINVKLSFKIDKKTHDVVVRVINRETGELIRQIPPDELLKLRQKLEELVGVLFHGTI